MPSERRIKVVHVHAEQVLEFFLESPNLRVYKFKDLPDETKTLSVGYSVTYDSFCFTVTHPSFPVVPLHIEPERLESPVEYVQLSESQKKELSNFLGRP